MLLSKVIPEVLNIATPRGGRAWGNEAISPLAVSTAGPELPGCGSDSGCVDNGANGSNITVACKPAPTSEILRWTRENGKHSLPDHEFVVATVRGMVDVRSGEQVI
jgi:hypothetical protein